MPDPSDAERDAVIATCKQEVARAQSGFTETLADLREHLNELEGAANVLSHGYDFCLRELANYYVTREKVGRLERWRISLTDAQRTLNRLSKPPVT